MTLLSVQVGSCAIDILDSYVPENYETSSPVYQKLNLEIPSQKFLYSKLRPESPGRLPDQNITLYSEPGGPALGEDAPISDGLGILFVFSICLAFFYGLRCRKKISTKEKRKESN